MSKQSAYFKVPGLNGAHQIKEIKRSLDQIPGVISVSANDREDQIAVDYDSTGTDHSAIEQHLRKIGFNAELIDNQNHIM